MAASAHEDEEQQPFAGGGQIYPDAGQRLALRETREAPKRHAISFVAFAADQIVVAEHVSPTPEGNLRCRPLAAGACQFQIPRSPALSQGSEPAHDHLPVNPAETLSESFFRMNAQDSTFRLMVPEIPGLIHALQAA